MGIDRDLDGLLDADVPPPRLQIAAAGNKLVLNWPFSAAGFLLEETPSLTTTWSSSTNAVEIASPFNVVTNPPGAGAKFFRLHLP